MRALGVAAGVGRREVGYHAEGWKTRVSGEKKWEGCFWGFLEWSMMRFGFHLRVFEIGNMDAMNVR
jgi:hypothetical protein